MQIEIIRQRRKSPILRPTAFGCLQAIPSINITRGCLHSCVYCYARGFTDAPRRGEIHLYQDLPELLEGELARKRRFPSWVSFSTASDPFQDLDEVLAINYQTMKLLLERGIGISFLSKGFVSSEFVDLFRQRPHLVKARIGLVSLDEAYRSLFEPFSAYPHQRLLNIRTLLRAGIETRVRMDPLIPGINDSENSLGELMHTLKAAGVREVSISYLLMRPSIMGHFQSELTSRLANGILRHYEGQPWQRVITSARTKLLPRAMRMVHFKRIKALAREQGILCSLCGCKNPDLPWESCHAWMQDQQVQSEGRQLNLFA